MTRASRWRNSDRGETLLEILISIAILGIVVTGLIAALTTAIKAGDTHRHLTDVEVVARSYGEALVDQASHPAKTTVGSGSSGTTLIVSSAPAGLPTANFYIAVDAEVLKVVSGPPGTTWTLDKAPIETHSTGAIVSYYPLYDACMTKTRLQPTYTQPASTLTTISAPQLDAATPLEFFTAAGAAVPSATGCADYWTTVAPCSAFDAPQTHLTECDPASLRATIAVSTKASTPNKATTTTKVIVRRGNE